MNQAFLLVGCVIFRAFVYQHMNPTYHLCYRSIFIHVCVANLHVDNTRGLVLNSSPNHVTVDPVQQLLFCLKMLLQTTAGNWMFPPQSIGNSLLWAIERRALLGDSKALKYVYLMSPHSVLSYFICICVFRTSNDIYIYIQDTFTICVFQEKRNDMFVNASVYKIFSQSLPALQWPEWSHAVYRTNGLRANILYNQWTEMYHSAIAWPVLVPSL